MKQWRRPARSLSDAEGREDAAEDVFGIDAPGDAVQGAGGEANIFRSEFQVFVLG